MHFPIMPKIKENKNIIFIFIPALITFCLILIPTFKYQWPLSWDIFYHIHISQLYLENGLIFFDDLTYAPYGRPIFYPPLFHFLLISLKEIFGWTLFDSARYIQPVLGSLTILSFSFVAYRMYNATTGFLTGIFVMFTTFFSRMIIPIPETMALILLPLLAYFYYISLENNKLFPALLAGILLGMVLLTHLLSSSIIILIILIYTIIIGLIQKEPVLKQFLVLLATSMAIAAVWYLPLILSYGFSFKSPPAQGIELFKYLTLFGIVPLIFSFIGSFYASKRRKKQDLLILVWTIAILLFSLAHFIGIPVLSERILNFAVFPLMLLAALGIQCITVEGDKRPAYILMALIIIFGFSFGYSTVNSASPFIKPSDFELSKWFKDNGDKESLVVSYNYELDPLIVSISRQPVSAGGYAPGMLRGLNILKYLQGDFNRDDIRQDQAGYIILPRGVAEPPYSRLVYLNKNYKVFELEKN
ncbi:glycosyltransferase family 39 protein [Methanobacterium alkalithermotolerans]|uniref:Glycosyltransferase family 39 protein n=1 Tax=Methanobacterium alkalithermotolerans TaxID=2731220 RepID=A0A8T8K4Y4_9EURY|nr:STT3 domain-containing protein [Methanobacterium alkalithermotolerans]QUH23574.1 glycosyltransferase family 39 protein [Methanobacterium alkalithermotolerans]